MTPITQKMIDFLGVQDQPPIEDRMDPASHEDKFDPRILQLRIKRKRQMQMIRQMLEQGGYGDLAKMATISRRDYDADLGE